MGFKSDIGLAVATFPAQVATFRIWCPANQWRFSRIARNPLVFHSYSSKGLSTGMLLTCFSRDFLSLDNVTKEPARIPFSVIMT